MDLVDRYPLLILILSFVFYPFFAWAVLRLSPRRVRMQLFAVVNLAGLAAVCVLSGAKSIRVKQLFPYTRVALVFFVAYVVLALLHYMLLRLSKRDGTAWPMVASLSPIAFLVFAKYFAESIRPLNGLVAPVGISHYGALFVGVSYLSFRLVLLVQEVRSDAVAMPSVWEYLSFAFYLPTLTVGPINPYSRFIGSLRSPDREKTPVGRSLLRIVVGFTKYIFLGSLLAQFTYVGLMRDGHLHGRLDLALSFLAYPLYLYCNFSGFCDMVIGVSGLLGIEVMENFDRPFLTRNIQEFWNHWHMTLSTWIRDLVFTPLTKAMMRRVPPKSANHVIALSLMISFLLVGMWHGVGMNFAVFGALQGLGLVSVHYYTIWLKKRLGREKFGAYRKSQPIRVAATVLNFLYFAFTLFFFANSWDAMGLMHQAMTQR